MKTIYTSFESWERSRSSDAQCVPKYLYGFLENFLEADADFLINTSENNFHIIRKPTSRRVQICIICYILALIFAKNDANTEPLMYHEVLDRLRFHGGI